MPSEPAFTALLAGPRAQRASASGKPSGPPAPARPPLRRLPGVRGAAPAPTRVSPVSGRPGGSPPAPRVPAEPAREPWRPREAWGLREVRESRDYGGPGLGAHPRTGPEAGPRGSYCFTLSPRASLKFFLAASSSLTKVAIAARVFQPDRRPRGPRPPATERSTRRKACAMDAEGSTRPDSTRLGSARLGGHAPSRSGEGLVHGPARLTVRKAASQTPFTNSRLSGHVALFDYWVRAQPTPACPPAAAPGART